jgi:signal transduction histidine kinase
VPEVVMLDEDAITKICTNLVGNAFKFTESGSVRLHLMFSSEGLIVEVSDTGIGIPAHMQEVIFESFRQVDASSTRAYGGSGLGLSIVRNLCLAMKGSIRVESKSGQGSTFIVTIPLELEKVAA